MEGQTPAQNVDVLIVGAGPAGLATAASLGELGVRAIVLDREPQPGGLPAQCEHAGFGLWAYKRLMRGRDFAARIVTRAERAGADIRTNTTVLSITREREVLAVSPNGLARYRANTLVLATGCRELPRSTRLVAGSRPAGVFNTGVVQRLHTFLHVLPGREIVLIGSDDMGLMAAQTLAQLGARVRAVVEERPYRLGYLGLEWLTLRRSRIPLLLNHRVRAIHGAQRVNGIEVAPARGAPFTISCDTVIFSGEFFPENVLLQQAGVPLDAATQSPVVDQNFQTDALGIFACGNLIHAADAADHALAEGERTAEAVADFMKRGTNDEATFQPIVPGAGVRAVVPQRLRWYDSRLKLIHLALRVDHAQWGVRVHARVHDDVWGNSYALVAKPHRSIYVRIAPQHAREPLIISAQGFALAREERDPLKHDYQTS